MVKKIKFREEVITPEIAKEYLKKNTNNRSIDNNRCKYYTEQMKKGLWSLTPEGISFDEYGRLLDGQHRLTAIVNSGVSQKMIVMSDFDKEVFTKINRGKGRTASDDLSILNIKEPTIISSGILAYLKYKKNKTSTVDKNVISDRSSVFKGTFSSDEVIMEYETKQDFYDTISKDVKKLYAKNNFRLYQKAEYFVWMVYLIQDLKHPYEKVYDFFMELNTHSKVDVVNDLRNRILVSNKDRNTSLEKRYKQRLLVKCWNIWISGQNPKKLMLRDTEVLELI